MAAAGKGGSDEFEAAARRYWDMWSAAAGAGSAGAEAQAEPFAAWSRFASIQPPLDIASWLRGGGQYGVDWLAAMQGVAARLAGKDTSAAEVAKAWRETLQAQAAGPWANVFTPAGSASGAPLDSWSQFVQAATAAAEPWLDLPSFGPSREHQSRWQQWVKLQRDYQRLSQAYEGQLRAVFDDAFALFEARLAQHELPGTQLGSARELFDLWIDVAEEAYAKVALSEAFQQLYGDLANAYLQLRATAQQELEQAMQSAGMPTRSEMDTAHRKIAELERLVHQLMKAQNHTQAQADGQAKARTPKQATRPRTTKASKKAAPASAVRTRAKAVKTAPVAAPKKATVKRRKDTSK